MNPKNLISALLTDNHFYKWKGKLAAFIIYEVVRCKIQNSPIISWSGIN